MEVDHQHISAEANGETSREGLRRMRKLACEAPTLNSISRGVIHPVTSQLIYPSPSPQRYGYLTSSIFTSSHPKHLPTPSILNPGSQISISPNGEWTLIFHPNSTPEGEGEGSGTLSIYRSEALLSPLSNSANVIPLSNFQLPCEPLSIIHLYPPRTSLPSKSNSRSRPLGPSSSTSQSTDYDNDNDSSSSRPSFLVLLEFTILYFYSIPTGNGQTNSNSQWTMTFLDTPINSKSQVFPNPNGLPTLVSPTEDEFRIKKGWLGLVPSNTGVWLGWESTNEVGVTRVEIGLDKFGRRYLQTIPMPTIPRLEKIPFSENIQHYRQELQGIFFMPLDNETIENVKKENLDGMQIDGQNGDQRSSEEVDRVGAVFVYNDIAQSSSSTSPVPRTRIQVHSFERREIELAQGFDDIASGGGEMISSWDWSIVPRPIHHYTSPLDTSVIALHPLPSIPPYTLALALISQPTGLSLVHINLSSSEWTTVGEPIELGELKGETELDLVISQGISRGQLGLAALIGKEAGPTLLVVPRVEGQSTLGESTESSSLSIDAAASIILAERDGVDWSDVVRAVIGSVGVGKRKDTVADLNKQIYSFAIKEDEIDELSSLSRVQIALFSSTNDPRLELASDILRLKGASDLINRCAIFGKDGTIGFDLDCIWPIIGILEWSIALISRSMREIIILGAQMEYSTGNGSQVNPDFDFDQPSPIIILINPEFRKLVVRILSQLNQFISFITQLDRPILQPETPTNNQSTTGGTGKRDAMATIIARDRIRDIAYQYGIDIIEWGKGLERVSSKETSSEDSNSSLFNLSMKSISKEAISNIIKALPDSSNLFLSMTQSDLSTKPSYDAMTYSPLSTATPNTNVVRCSRCQNITQELHNLSDGHTNNSNNPMNDLIASTERSPWVKWKSHFRQSCLCGGIWERGTPAQRR